MLFAYIDVAGLVHSAQHRPQGRRRDANKRTAGTASHKQVLTRQLEEAVKTYQKALQLHQEKRWAEAERAYLNLLMTEIISDRLSKKVPPITLLRVIQKHD
jgi:hypothetical protein